MEEKVLNIVLEKRFRRKIDSAVTAGKNTLIVFFKDGKTKKCNIKKIAGGDRGYAFLEANEEYFKNVEMQPGGNGVKWENIFVFSYEQLYQAGEELKLSYEEFVCCIRNGLVNTAEAAQMLDCSRQNIDDLYFVCYMIEQVARQLKQRNRYVVNSIGRTGLYHLISCAETLHCENPDKVADDWIRDYNLTEGNFDITAVDPELADVIPTALDMGEVYQRLIVDTLGANEDYIDGILRVYNNPICDVIDNYNCSAFYEPSYVIARAYQNGGF